MPPRETHFEPFIHVPDVGAEEALIAWGGFYFVPSGSRWRLADDEELARVAGPGRSQTIGARSEPYGEAEVEVMRGDAVVARGETAKRNNVWVQGLEPDTEYRYRVVVDGRIWAEGERRDWDMGRRDLAAAGRRYDNRFRTLPPPGGSEPLTFAAFGDYGVGILERTEESERQLRLARALERALDSHGVRFVVTTGDNVYLGSGQTSSGSGGEDDDWFGSFYAPYRYVVNRVPFLPTVGNHDAADTERADDRDQLSDNFYLETRFRSEVEAGRASLGPGLFYRVRTGANLELVCIDTSLAADMEVEHYFDDRSHADWLRRALESPDDGERPRWRIPFSHHPPFCAGPEHGPTPGMVERLVPLFERAGVRVVLSGHEHNFQHALVNGVHYLVSGAAGKLRTDPPTQFGVAGTRAWAAAGHLLLVEAEADRLVVHPVRDVGVDGSLEYVELVDPDGAPVEPPIEIR